MKLFSKERRNCRKKFYKSSVWRKIRANQLRKASLCEHCLAEIPKKITLATHIDHINPNWEGWAGFIKGPFQSLCLYHSNFKTFQIDLPKMIKKQKTTLEVIDI